MDVREKLVELLTDNLPRIGKLPKCDNPLQYTSDEIVERIADHLIANGVTVQEWIPLSEQKPGRDDLVLVFFEGMRDTNCAIQVMYGWCMGGSASHWMPLPQPPKGE